MVAAAEMSSESRFPIPCAQLVLNLGHTLALSREARKKKCFRRNSDCAAACVPHVVTSHFISFFSCKVQRLKTFANLMSAADAPLSRVTYRTHGVMNFSLRRSKHVGIPIITFEGY
jgi:hypothetical protein